MDHHRRLDSELDVLRDRVLVLGGEAEEALVRAMYALTERDSAAARGVLEGDDNVDRLEVEIDRLCIDVLALRQPAARDLRFVISVAKITPILERIADHACNIARAAIDLNDEPRLKSYPDLSRMAAVASSMLRAALDAFTQGDATAARRVIEQRRRDRRDVRTPLPRPDRVDGLGAHVHAARRAPALRRQTS